jgi:hypothetical protein
MAVIRLSPDTYLSTDDGIIITKDQAERIISQTVIRQKNLTVSETATRIVGRDQQIINLSLDGLNETVPSTQGFLVTFYLSSSNGSPQRMYKKRIVNPADLSVVRGSFDDYIEVGLDV